MVNRLTATWYLDWLQTELLFRLGFLEALAGDWDAAQAHWQKVADHDPMLARAQENRFFNTLYRLNLVPDYGHFVGYPEENVRIPDRVKPALWWADFQLLREEFELAESLYRRLYDNAGPRDAALGARSGLGLMLRNYGESAGRTERRGWLSAQTVDLGAEILRRYPNAPAAPQVALRMAKATPNQGEGGRAAARAAYRRVYRQYRGSRYAEEARFWEAYTLITPETLEESLPEVNRFRADYPSSRWAVILDEEVEFMRWFRELPQGPQRARDG